MPDALYKVSVVSRPLAKWDTIVDSSFYSGGAIEGGSRPRRPLNPPLIVATMDPPLNGVSTRIRSVERGICPIAAVCTVLLSWSRDSGHANFSETFVRGHVGTIPGNTPAKFEVCTFSRFRAISI